MSDEEIDTSDIPSLSDEFFEKAQLRMPKSPVKIMVKVDLETYSTWRCYEVQEPHPQPPKSKR
jgi:hypothetical protein